MSRNASVFLSTAEAPGSEHKADGALCLMHVYTCWVPQKVSVSLLCSSQQPEILMSFPALTEGFSSRGTPAALQWHVLVARLSGCCKQSVPNGAHRSASGPSSLLHAAQNVPEALPVAGRVLCNACTFRVSQDLSGAELSSEPFAARRLT